MDTLPASLDDWLDLRLDGCPCGRPHAVPTKEIVRARHALADHLGPLARRHLPPGPVVIVADRNTWRVAGMNASGLLVDAGHAIVMHHLEDEAHPPHADDETIAAVAETLERARAVGVVAVGSGTINDIGKAAATSAGIPQITVATAASMNGYTSAIAAITSAGVKTTVPANPPVAIVADPAVVATAPARMSAAGYGDLLSKSASAADWTLGHVLFGDPWCELPIRVVEEAIEHCIENAARIRTRHPEGLAVLTEALMRSGISMVLAGSSAPASGGEHLLSHLWDMTAHWTDRTPALHGEQTAVGTLIALAVWRQVLALEPGDIRHLPPDESPRPDEIEAFVADRFGDLAPAVLPHASRQALDEVARRERRDLLAARWDLVREKVGPVTCPPEVARQRLLDAGAPTTAAEIGVSEDEVRFALSSARWIRDRYTVLDLAADLGILEERAEEILEDAGVL
jgi:glycerol-1-phosphate dehydrogenase [NAD(P)+]